MGRLKHAARRGIRIALAMILSAALILGLTEAAVVLAAERMLACCRVGAPGPHLDVAVVLGGPMDPDGTPAWATRRRVAAGVRLLQIGEADLLILSGGHNMPEKARGWGMKPPGETMRDLALTMGAPAEALLVEPNARTTVENIDFSLAMAEVRGLKRIGVVSDAWHLPRAMAFAAWRGRDDLRPVAVDIRPWQWTRDTPMLYAREAAAWWYGLARILGLVHEGAPAPV
jgi:uncharacterized SAM-binding protein YcdF (DUF218 family)